MVSGPSVIVTGSGVSETGITVGCGVSGAGVMLGCGTLGAGVTQTLGSLAFAFLDVFFLLVYLVISPALALDFGIFIY